MRTLRWALLLGATMSSACGALIGLEPGEPRDAEPANDAALPDTLVADAVRDVTPDARDGGGDARFTTVGVLRPSTGDFVLRFSNDTDAPDVVVRAKVPATALPIAAPWTGADTLPGYFDPDTNEFVVITSIGADASTTTATYTLDLPEGGPYQPLAGTWQTQGVAAIGAFDPTLNVFYVRDSLSSGLPERTVQFGAAHPSNIAIVGDWDGDGIDGFGFVRPDAAGAAVFVVNTLRGGSADDLWTIPRTAVGSAIVSGDWFGIGRDTLGIFDPAASTFYLAKAPRGPGPEATVKVGGGADYRPMAGHWPAIP